jgi:hypothetical protein
MDHTEPESSRQRETTGEHLLLSSLAEFWSLVEPLLVAARPARICEVGIGQGEFTTELLEFCKANSCRYAGIDPRADGLIMQQACGALAEFFQGLSLAMLPALSPQDVYFLDGDHNYYTVSNELKLVVQPDRWPLIFVHDVCWPWGRRDQYCSPESIPEAFRHPYSATQRVAPGRGELGPDGFSGEDSVYPYSIALHEGGPRNGVLTAIEDFIHEYGGNEWRLVIVPAVFGLGIMYAPKKCPAELKEMLEQLAKSMETLAPMLESLERNRIDLFMNFLRNVKDSVSIHADYRALAEHEAQLRAEYDRLLRHTKALQQAYDDLKAVAVPQPETPSMRGL